MPPVYCVLEDETLAELLQLTIIDGSLLETTPTLPTNPPFCVFPETVPTTETLASAPRANEPTTPPT